MGRDGGRDTSHDTSSEGKPNIRRPQPGQLADAMAAAAKRPVGDDAPNGAAVRVACEAAGMQTLLHRIADQIADADRRHGEALQDMQTRLTDLAERTVVARQGAPRECTAGLRTIEGRIEELTRSFAAVGRVWQDNGQANSSGSAFAEAPAPSAAPGSAPGSARTQTWIEPKAALIAAQSGHGQPTTKALTDELMAIASPAALSANGAAAWTTASAAASPNDPSSPWDNESADALARIYADFGARAPLEPSHAPLYVEAPLGFDVLPTTDAAPVAPIATPPAPRHQPAPDRAFDIQALNTPGIGVHADRAWLETRFAEIAGQLESSLSEFRPNHAISALGHRFDILENRLDAALGAFQKGVDDGALYALETQIASLKSQLDAIATRLGGFDTLPTDIGLVLDQTKGVRSDLAELAQVLIDQAVSPPARTAEHARFDALQGLLEAHVVERRDGESATVSVLAQIQSSLERLADRMHAVEQGLSHTIQHPFTDGTADDEDQAIAFGQREARASQPPREAALAASARGEADIFRKARARPASVRSDEPAAPVSMRPGARTPDPRTSAPAASGILGAARRAAVQAAKQTPAAANRAPVTAMPETEDDSEMPVVSTAREAAKSPREALFSAASMGNRRIQMVLVIALLAASAGMLWGIFSSKSEAPQTRIEKPRPAAKLGALDDATVQPGAELAAADGTAPTGVSRGAGDRELNVDTRDDTQDAAALPGAEDGNRIVTSTTLSQIPTPAQKQTQSPNAPAASTAETVNVATRYTAGIMLDHGAQPMGPYDVRRYSEEQRVARLSSEIGQKLALRTAGELVPPAAMPAALTPAPPIAPDTALSGRGIEPRSDATASTNRAADMPPAQIGPNSLRTAALNGDPSAEFEVASRFAQGKGVPKDFLKAAEWYQRAASRGFAPAQYRLGGLFERGIGVGADPVRARIWYRRAAEAGNVKAMHNLAVMHTQRSAAQQPDYTTAVQWFSQAAERGLADSQFNLGILHENGMGLTRSQSEAYKWFALAADRGDAEAAKRRAMLEGKLEPAELALLKSAIAGWQAKPIDQIANDPIAAGQAWRNRDNETAASGATPAQAGTQPASSTLLQAKAGVNTGTAARSNASAQDAEVLDLSSATIDGQISEQTRKAQAQAQAQTISDDTASSIQKGRKLVKMRSTGDVEQLLTKMGYDPSKLKVARPETGGPSQDADQEPAN